MQFQRISHNTKTCIPDHTYRSAGREAMSHSMGFKNDRKDSRKGEYNTRRSSHQRMSHQKGSFDDLVAFAGLRGCGCLL